MSKHDNYNARAYKQQLIRFMANDPLPEAIEAAVASTGQSKNQVIVEAIRRGLGMEPSTPERKLIAELQARVAVLEKEKATTFLGKLKGVFR